MTFDLAPKSWRKVCLSDCCKIISGATPRRDNPEYWGGTIPWVTPKDLSKLEGTTIEDAPEYITEKGYRSCSTDLLPKGAVLFSSRAPIGHVAIAGRPMCTNQGFKSLIPGDEVASSYLYWCLMKLVPEISARGTGTTFKEVSKAVMEDFKIPLPPLSEQKRIAAILDKADAIRRKRQQAVKLTEELLRSVFLDMFGDPVTNPKGWSQAPIKEFGMVMTGNTPSREKPEYYGKKIEWIKSDNINTPYHYLTEARERLSEEGQKVGRIVPAGSILVTCIAGSPECIGNVALSNRDVAFNQQINAISPFEGIDSFFLYSQILVAKKLIQGESTESMKGMVNKGKFENILLIKPPIELQKKYCGIFKKLEVLSHKNDKAFNNSDSLFTSLLQRAFRGEL